jgi:hypothetical protein
LLQGLRGAVREFVSNGKERVFWQVSDKQIGNVSGVPGDNMPAFTSS